MSSPLPAPRRGTFKERASCRGPPTDKFCVSPRMDTLHLPRAVCPRAAHSPRDISDPVLSWHLPCCRVRPLPLCALQLWEEPGSISSAPPAGGSNQIPRVFCGLSRPGPFISLHAAIACSQKAACLYSGREPQRCACPCSHVRGGSSSRLACEAVLRLPKLETLRAGGKPARDAASSAGRTVPTCLQGVPGLGVNERLLASVGLGAPLVPKCCGPHLSSLLGNPPAVHAARAVLVVMTLIDVTLFPKHAAGRRAGKNCSSLCERQWQFSAIYSGSYSAS